MRQIKVGDTVIVKRDSNSNIIQVKVKVIELDNDHFAYEYRGKEYYHIPKSWVTCIVEDVEIKGKLIPSDKIYHSFLNHVSTSNKSYELTDDEFSKFLTRITELIDFVPDLDGKRYVAKRFAKSFNWIPGTQNIWRCIVKDELFHIRHNNCYSLKGDKFKLVDDEIIFESGNKLTLREYRTLLDLKLSDITF